MQVALELAVLVSLTGAGALIVKRIYPRASSIDLAALGFPLGGGLFTLALFLVSWVGIRLVLTTLLIVMLLLLGISLALGRWLDGAGIPAWWTKRIRGPRGMALEMPGRSLTTGLLAVAGFALLAGFISVGRAHSNWDAAAMWIVKGYGIAEEGSIFGGRDWGGHALAYPLNIHLLVSTFRLASGDLLPGSQLIFTAFYASTLMALLAYWRESGAAPWLATAGTLFTASVPVLFLHGTIGFANLPMAFYVAIGSTYVLRGCDLGDRRALATGGILLGLASWTILEGFLYAGTAAITILAFSRLSRAFDHADHLPWLAPFGAITAIWLVFYLRFGVGGSQASGAVSAMFDSFRAGDFNLTELRLIFGYVRRYLFDLSIWGLTFPLGGLLLLLGRNNAAHPGSTYAFATLCLFLTTALLTAGLFYLRSFVGLDFLAWLMRGFPRTFLTSAIFFLATIVLVVPRAVSPPVISASVEA